MEALTHLGLSNLELQLADAMTGLETTVAIGNITATHGCESQMWLRQMKCGAQHLLFKYCPGSLLAGLPRPRLKLWRLRTSAWRPRH